MTELLVALCAVFLVVMGGKALGGAKLANVIVFDDGADLANVSCSVPAIHASEIVAWLKALDGTLSEADVEKTFSAIKAQMTRK